MLLNGQPVTDQTRKIAAGDAVEITVPQAQDSYIGPQDIPLDVVFEDDDLVVINKAVGMVVHPARDHLMGRWLTHCCIIAVTAFQGLADKNVRALCTVSTKIPVACWCWPKPIGHIMGWRPNLKPIRSSAITAQWYLGRLTPTIRDCAASKVLILNPVISCG